MIKLKCSKCGKRKGVKAFGKRSDRPRGHRSACKLCEKKQYAEAGRRYRQRNRERFKGRTSDWRMRKVYGVTKEWLDLQYQKQDGKCAICRVGFDYSTSNKHSPVIDHDHATGETRGLLCRNCNRAVGLMSDDPDKLKRAAEYLHKRGYEVRL